MTELTDRQRQVLQAILRITSERGMPPTVRGLGRLLGIVSPNGVLAHLDALERKGVVEMLGLTARGLRVRGVRWIPQFDGSPAGQLAKEVFEEMEADGEGTENAPSAPMEKGAKLQTC